MRAEALHMEQSTAPASSSRGCRFVSVGGIPDRSKHVVIVLAGSAAEIGVELAERTRLRPVTGSHNPSAFCLNGGMPAAGLGALRQDPVVGMGLGALYAFGDDVDVGQNADTNGLARVAAASSRAARSGSLCSSAVSGSDPLMRGEKTYGKRSACQTLAAAFFPRRTSPAPRARFAPKKPSAQVLRMRCAPKTGSKAFRFPSRSRHREGIGSSREQQKRTRP